MCCCSACYVCIATRTIIRRTVRFFINEVCHAAVVVTCVEDLELHCKPLTFIVVYIFVVDLAGVQSVAVTNSARIG